MSATISQASITCLALCKYVTLPLMPLIKEGWLFPFKHAEGLGTHQILTSNRSRSLSLFCPQTAEFSEKDHWLGLPTRRNLFTGDLKAIFMWDPAARLPTPPSGVGGQRLPGYPTAGRGAATHSEPPPSPPREASQPTGHRDNAIFFSFTSLTAYFLSPSKYFSYSEVWWWVVFFSNSESKIILNLTVIDLHCFFTCLIKI